MTANAPANAAPAPGSAPSLERLARSRRLRILLAGGLAACGLWAFAPYAMSEVGGEAFVNAPLTRIASPIAGTVAPGLPEAGIFIPRERRLRLVTARSLDTDALGALQGQAAALRAGLALATRQLAEISAADSRMAARAGAYRRVAIDRFDAGSRAADADAVACDAETGASRLQLARIEALSAQGFASGAGVERARAAADAGAARCAALSARAFAAASETDAARRGLYLGGGASETPYMEQQRDRLLLRRQELETIATDARARIDQIDARIAAERQRLARAAAYDTSLAPGSIVWAVAASPGASVTPGAALLDLADCTRRFVEVTLPERRMEAVLPGQAVRVRLIGADAWMTGRVMRSAGAAARRDVAMVAANEASRDSRALTVEVSLPPAAPAAAARRCDIGRLAEVRFSRWGG
jgi:multidrug resistance efflux pump